MALEKTVLSRIFAEFVPISIKRGPLPDQNTLTSLHRLETVLSKEIEAWETESTYPYRQQCMGPMIDAYDNLKLIESADSEEAVRNLIRAIKGSLTQIECISHDSKLFTYLVEVYSKSQGIFNHVYNAVFRNFDISILNDLTVRLHTFSAISIILNDQIVAPSQPAVDDLDRRLGDYSERFLAATTAYQSAKDAVVADWEITKNETKNVLEAVMQNSAETISQVESEFSSAKETYEELLSLDSPMGYWKAVETRAKNSTVIWSIATGVLICGLIGTAVIAYLTVPSLLVEPNKAYSISEIVKWFILSSLVVSVQVFGLRQTTKVAFSSLHLARDASERRTLAYLYLTLNRRGKVGDIEEKKIVLNALFSRAETGLLKGESGPVIPNSSIIDRLFGKGN